MPNKLKPLWKVDDQQARLAELAAPSDEPVKDNPLRRDVDRSAPFWASRGRAVRSGIIRVRRSITPLAHRPPRERAAQSGEASSSELMSKAHETSLAWICRRAYQVTKAFATYFELTNLAETNHRKRRRRAGQLDREQAPQPGSFRGTLLRMKHSGISAEECAGRLDQIKITPVFTAHPTEVARQTVLLKRRRIGKNSRSSTAFPLLCRRGRLRGPYPGRSHFALADRRSSPGQTHRR